MVALFHMDTLVMPLKIRLAHKLLGAAVDLAGEVVLASLVVRLQVRLEVVAATEELATTPDIALEIGILLGRELSWRTP